MTKKLLIANWKMNPQTLNKARELFNAENEKFNNVQIIICPPFIYLEKLGNPGPQDDILYMQLGAQNCHHKNKGAFTGKISAQMLKQIGCQYVIVGHSETGDNNEIVNQKIKLCLQNDLTPIVCLSEKQQILPRLQNIKQIEKVILAYEPVKAIGSGKPQSSDQVLSMRVLIHRLLFDVYDQDKVKKIKIIYGGSVNAQNAINYIKEAKIDGLLIGSASLNPKKFLQIAQNIDQQQALLFN